MHKVIYALSGLDEWVDVVENLRLHNQWEPVYWLTQASKNHGLVIKHFPDVIAHTSQDANRCIPAIGHEEFMQGVIGSNILNDLNFYERISMQLMDRMDVFKCFSYIDRQDYYLKLIMYWINIISHIKPDYVVFNTPPHSVAEYLLYAVARYKNVETRIYITTGIDGLLYANDSVENYSDRLKNTYDEVLKRKQLFELSDMTINFMQHIRSDVTNPWYISIAEKQRETKEKNYKKKMERIKPEKDSRSYGLLERYALALEAANKTKNKNPEKEEKLNKVINRIIKLPEKRLCDSYMKRGEYNIYLREVFEKKLLFKETYLSLVTNNLDYEAAYIYMPLHYQPERTTCPDGGVYSNQMLMVRMISQYLPENWSLYVKEHASQFSYNGNGDLCRTDDFYNDINMLPNVKLIDLKEDTYTLIKNAKGVATVTGMAGWEAVCRGIPVMIFGNAWYRLCHGIMFVSDISDCKQAIEEIQKGYVISQEKVDAFAYTLESISRIGYINSSNALPVETSYEEHVAALTAAIQDSI